MWMQDYIGDLKPIVDQLHERIPLQGACEFPRSKNKKLDKFRRAQNVIYDLFNNGLMNRRGEWKRTMGTVVPIASYKEQCHIRPDADYWDRIERMVAPTMRGIILDAAEEQCIKMPKDIFTVEELKEKLAEVGLPFDEVESGAEGVILLSFATNDPEYGGDSFDSTD